MSIRKVQLEIGFKWNNRFEWSVSLANSVASQPGVGIPFLAIVVFPFGLSVTFYTMKIYIMFIFTASNYF